MNLKDRKINVSLRRSKLMYLCKLFSLMKIKFNNIEIENNRQRVVIKKAKRERRV